MNFVAGWCYRRYHMQDVADVSLGRYVGSVWKVHCINVFDWESLSNVAECYG